MKPIFAQSMYDRGAWRLPKNDVWNVPDGVAEIRGEMSHYGPWQIITKYRALAVTLNGKVFGIRSLDKPRESGYQLEGRVRVCGKSYRGFTSSRLFVRDDGSLVDVATIVVCGEDKDGEAAALRAADENT